MMNNADLVTIANRKREHIGRLGEALSASVAIMEVCGTHTVEIRKNGIHSMLPKSVSLVSGPGCPVCVTPASYIDNAIALIEKERVVIATFGDMVKVPGREGTSLTRYLGSEHLRIVYSPTELLPLAASTSKQVVFLGIGFETTIPTIASIFLKAAQRRVDNLSLYPAFKTIAPALRALLEDENRYFHGFLLPGHVSVIIGEEAYTFLASEYEFPGVITGFQPLDILFGIETLLSLIVKHESGVQNCYTRAVRFRGNPKAQSVIARFLSPVDAQWRGLGTIPSSGMGIREEFAYMDAGLRFSLPALEQHEPAGCLCSSVIQGRAIPPECGHFGTRCTPEQPVGPCMVSSEGTCAAYLRYGDVV